MRHREITIDLAPETNKDSLLSATGLVPAVTQHHDHLIIKLTRSGPEPRFKPATVIKRRAPGRNRAKHDLYRWRKQKPRQAHKS